MIGGQVVHRWDAAFPGMRGTATAAYLLVVTFIGLAMGPYTIGRLSDVLGDVRPALGLGLLANAAALACLWWASRWLEADEKSLRARAYAAGEPGP